MGEIILYIASSLDGFIASEDGSVDWLESVEEPDPEEDYGYQELFERVDTVLMGRKTYEQILGFGEWPYESKRCIVFTREPLAYSDERVEFVDEPAAFLGNLLDDGSAATWLVGGSETASYLLKEGLIRHMIITMLPIVLGGGIHLFQGLEREFRLKLLEMKSYPNSFIQLHYELLKG